MRVLIVGAGAIGRWFAEELKGIGCEVHFATRMLDDIVPVAADLAVVAVKAFDTPGAIATLERALARPDETTILCLQNGVGNEEQLAAHFGADAIVAGALTIPVERGEAGSKATNRGGLSIAPWGKQAHNWLHACLGRLSFPVTVDRDARSLKWSKAALNTVANASCAILDLDPTVLVADSRLFALEIAALREISAVLGAAKIPVTDLPRYPVRALLLAARLPVPLAKPVLGPKIAGARGTKIPSLLMDLRDGKGRTEVGALNGAFAAEARRLRVAAPVHTTLNRLLQEITDEPSRWERYRGNPDALLAEIYQTMRQS